MRGRQIVVAGRKVDLVLHRYKGALLWDAYFADDPSGECLTAGTAFRTRRDLVAHLRLPVMEKVVRLA